MKLTKVHRAVTFKQSCWLKDYIDFNTKMRSTSKNTFEKNFFKLMNNSIYGKTMENLRKRVDVKLVSSKDDLVKLVASPCFQSHRIMNENLIVVKRVKEVLTLNKPCYVGMSILDLCMISITTQSRRSTVTEQSYCLQTVAKPASCEWSCKLAPKA
jgi:hypothetical protein